MRSAGTRAPARRAISRRLAAAIELEVLQAAKDAVDGAAALLAGAERMAAEAEVVEVQVRARRGAQRLDDDVVEHAAAVEETGSDEEGRRKAQAQQDRGRDAAVVSVAVVEGDAERAPGQTVLAQRAHRFAERQHAEVGLDPAHAVVELGRGGLRRKQRIALGENPVVGEHAEPRRSGDPQEERQQVHTATFRGDAVSRASIVLRRKASNMRSVQSGVLWSRTPLSCWARSCAR